MSRQTTAQKPPADDLDLSGFPTDTPASEYLYRAHSTRRAPWFFASDGGGRFDLAGDRGTCYLAETVHAAVRERLGDQYVASRVVAPEDARAMTVSILRLEADTAAAALEAPGAAAYPITGELTDMPDYTVTQAWARAFDNAGFDGIHYRGRFSHTEGSGCWAVFDTAGEHPRRPVEAAARHDGFAACRLAGLPVLPSEPVDTVGLTIIDPPAP